MADKKTSLLVLCFFLSMFSGLSVDIILPALPHIAENLHSNFADSQLIISIFFFGYAFAQLFFGLISDWRGRKNSLLVGLFIYLIATLICVFVDNVHTLNVLRVFQAIGACSAIVSSYAIVRTSFDGLKQVRAITYVTIGISFFPIVMSVLGGAINHSFGWRTIFAFAAVVSLCVIVLTLIILPSDSKRPKQSSLGNLLKDYALMIKDKEYWCYNICGITAFTALLCYISIAPLIIKQHTDSIHLGVLLAINSLVLVVFGLAANFTYKNVSLQRSIQIASLIMMVSGIILSIFHTSVLASIPFLFLLMYLMSAGIGVISPVAQVGLLKGYSASSGQANAFGGFSRFLVASVIANILTHYDNTLLVLGFIILGCGVVNFIVLKLARE